jgi:hypothetical protein
MSTTDTVRCPSCGENIPTDYVVCPYDGYSLIKELREKTRVKIKFREGVSRVYRLLRHPTKNSNIVFDEIVTNYDRKGPILILFLFGWVFGFQIAPYFNAYYIANGPAQDIIFIFILGFIGGIILSLVSLFFFIIFWYLISFIIHFSSKLITSSIAGASFKETLSVVGYSLVPYIVGMFILNILLFIIVPPTTNFFETNPTTGAVIGLSQEVAASVSLFYLLFFIGFSVWFVYLCSLGLEKLHRLSRVQSLAVPVGTLILYMFVAQMITI